MTHLIRLPRVLEVTGLSRSQLYRMLDEGEFPRPVKLGERTNAWPDVEVQEWIAKRIAER